ncbi:MAG: DNA polymerase I [Micrococcales bacterium]|nr:DNA polymerase I [Micrococcales bacterium]NBR54570.1 DNA polymerase I [Micrococcales bacterium]NBY44290.1 DNA polymerase I [Micrococcales bacterium]
MTSKGKPTLLLIDGHSLAFRAFYALSPDSFKTPDGQHTNAVHGFISMMLNIIANEKPTHLAVAFDLSRVSFRTEQYPEYKGTRGETPPEFNGQTELLTEALAAMNITTLTRENYEADDIIASLADQGAAQGFEVLIVSGDRDTFQLIQEEVTILYPVKGVMNLARMNDAAVVEKYGIHAKQYPDLAALVGETSDNLPGIPGVGPKTAAKWLQQYGDLASILKAAEEISGKVGESLREHRELVVRNRKLNHLVRDLDIGMPFESFAMKPVEEDNLRATFAKLHFRSLLERVFKGLGVIRSDKANVEAITLVSQAETTGAAQTQLELPNATELSEKALEKLFSSKTVVAVFPVFDEGDLIGVGLATDKERLYLDYKSNKKELGKFFESDVTKNIFDSKRIQRWLLNQKIHLESVIDDPMLMAYVENPLRRNFGAEELISEFLGLSISSTQEIGEDGLDLSAIAWYLNPLCKKINETLVQSKQDFIYKSVELPSARALAKMEQVGVSINTADLTKLIKQLDKEISQLASECYKIIAKEINLASPKQLQTVLFDDLGMQGTSKVKTGFSTNAEALTTLFEQTGHPFLEKLLQHREVTKIRQIVETISKTVESDGRIHTTYVQTGTSTGRLSSENPNLQNIPVRTERGRLIRDAFVVGDDYETLLTADYSQIEMRILAHLSQDSGLIEAFKSGEDLHKFVGARIYGVQPDEVTSAMRSKVKAMSYGLVYGLSEYGLAKQLRISNADAKQLMADYFARFGGVRNYLAKVVDDAKLNGFTTTIYGRRRPFDDLNSKIFTIRENARRAALNAPIQGTAADIMKLAMIKVDHLLVEAKMKSRILLQVHDELVIEVAKGELEKVKSLAIKGMTEAAKLDVPLEVSIGVGKSWDEAAH